MKPSEMLDAIADAVEGIELPSPDDDLARPAFVRGLIDAFAELDDDSPPPGPALDRRFSVVPTSLGSAGFTDLREKLAMIQLEIAYWRGGSSEAAIARVLDDAALVFDALTALDNADIRSVDVSETLGIKHDQAAGLVQVVRSFRVQFFAT